MTYSIRQIRAALRARLRQRCLRFGSFRNPVPYQENFGADGGTPVDRYYMEEFLRSQAELIKGCVLEVGGRDYTERFGTGVTESVVFSHEAAPGEAQIVGDLSDCPQVPDDSFDCIILTQTLHYFKDMTKAVGELHRILAPGGTLLCTVPGISQISRWDMERWGDRWRLTSLGLRELLESSFDPAAVTILAYGNALSAVCLIEGVPAQRLEQSELDARVADFEVLVCGVATKLQSCCAD